MNKQQLASKIWQGANDLRGKIAAAKYKDYMLGFMFYKYLSEKETEYLKNKLYFENEDLVELSEDDIETVENCQKNIGYFISYDNLFSTWIKKGQDFSVGDVRDALNAFNRLVGSNHKNTFDNIFDTLAKGVNDLGSQEGERTKAIKGLIMLINEIPMDNKQNFDVLGFVYEFLLKNFAANAGKAGEFYTPYEVSMMMSEIIADHLKDRDTIKIYDPTSGSGSLLINIGTTLAKHTKNKNSVQYYAQELIPDTYNLTRMNLVMRDILPDNIVVRCGDTLADDWPFFEENNKEATYDPVYVDACISNPPYSQPWSPENHQHDIRFNEYGIAPKSKADYAFLLHDLYHLRNDGIMAIVLPHGVLFRGGDEGEIRKNLIENDNIETIIGLPANIFYGTGIPTIVIILKKDRMTDDVLFVDASKGFIKDGNKNRLQAKDIKKIVDTVKNRKDVEKFARVVSKEEIRKNEYNLNIPRYVDSSEPSDVHDIYATMFGGIPNTEIDTMNKYWNVFTGLRENIFEQQDTPYSVVKVENVKETVKTTASVVDYISAYKETFGDFPSYLRTRLIENMMSMNISAEKSIIAEAIRERIAKIALVDFYDAYQYFDDEWTKISLDLEILQSEGFDAVRKVDANMVTKKKDGKEVEVQDGWLGRILPFELVQNVIFADDKKLCDEKNNKLSAMISEREDIITSFEEDDKSAVTKDDDDTAIDSKKFKAKLKEVKDLKKNGLDIEEDSFEEKILKIADLDENIKTIKNEIKDIALKLEEDTKQYIETISDEDAIVLIEKKWISVLCDKINDLPSKLINDFVSKVMKLIKKYETTLTAIDTEISEVEESLAEMLDELTGDEFDMKGISAFKALLLGE